MMFSIVYVHTVKWVIRSTNKLKLIEKAPNVNNNGENLGIEFADISHLSQGADNTQNNNGGNQGGEALVLKKNLSEIQNEKIFES